MHWEKTIYFRQFTNKSSLTDSASEVAPCMAPACCRAMRCSPSVWFRRTTKWEEVKGGSLRFRRWSSILAVSPLCPRLWKGSLVMRLRCPSFWWTYFRTMDGQQFMASLNLRKATGHGIEFTLTVVHSVHSASIQSSEFQLVGSSYMLHSN